MYPGKANNVRGVFVKHFCENIEKLGITVAPRALVVLNHPGILHKLFAYILFSVQAAWSSIFGAYDVLYVHYPTYSALPLLLVSPLLSRPLVLNVHGTDLFPLHKRSKILLKITRGLYTKADLIVCPSNFYRDLLIHDFGVEVERIFVSPSGGIDKNVFFPRKFGDPKIYETGKLSVGYVSRIEGNKGWKVLIKALELYADEIGKQHIDCTFIGDGSDFGKLTDTLRKSGLLNYRVLHSLPQEKLSEWYSEFDIFVFPTTIATESLGLVGLEAMACGTPVIASDIGGPSEYVTDNFNGFKFPPNDYQQLFEGLRYFGSLSALERTRLANAALATAESYESGEVAKRLAARLSLLV